jgi:phage shock protein A
VADLREAVAKLGEDVERLRYEVEQLRQGQRAAGARSTEIKEP